MTTVKELFAMSNEALLDAWQAARTAELQERYTTIPASEQLKHEAQLIRLVISFRLMGRETTPHAAPSDKED
jgi:hypothetical protein